MTAPSRARVIRAALLRAPLALLALVAAGVALRALALASWRPAALVHFDSVSYLDAAETGLFDDPIHPAGYAAFLRAASLVTGDSLAATVALQHALGVAAALVLYAAARRAGAPVAAALAPAALVLLAGDQVFLEHAVMSEAAFTPLVALLAYACVRAAGSPAPGRERLAWLAAAGALAAAAALVRSAGLALVPALALAAGALVPAFAARGASLGARFAPRLAAAGAVAVAAGAVLGGYLAAQAALSDRPGFTEVGGWALYGRAAPFADCDEFEPPAGTGALCERTPPERRAGGDFYAWVGGPARAAFGAPPRGNERVGAFARAAIRAQPLDYVEAVATDLARYVDPDAGPARPYSGDPPEGVGFERREPDAERASLQALARLGRPAEVERTGALALLEDWGRAVRVHGALLLALLALAAAGLPAARPGERRAITLLALVGLVLLAVPALSGFYNARYAVPAAGPIAAAAAIGLGALARTARTRSP